MSTTVERVSLIEERFTKPKLRHVPFAYTAVYWISIFMLFYTAWYCNNMLTRPISTFHLLDAKSPLATTCMKNSSPPLIRKLICLFSPTRPLRLRSTPKKQITKAPLLLHGWITFPFLVKLIMAYVGFFHEVFLLPGGRVNPSSKTWVFKLLRHSLLGWTTVSSCFVTLCFTIDPTDRVLLFLLLQASCYAFVGVSSALFFRRELIRFGLAMIHATKIILILSRGTIVGGSDVIILLVTEGLLEILAILVSANVVAVPLSGALFNILTTGSTLTLYAATVLVGTENPSFPETYANVLFPAATFGTVVVTCMVSGVFGFVSVMMISPSTYQAFRTTCSICLWSFLQFLMMSASFVKNPYKLSDVYDKDHRPVKFNFKPFWQQHPRYMPKRLDIPSIAS
jgi:hypothetical protein